MLPHLAKDPSRNNEDYDPLKKAVSPDYIDGPSIVTGALKGEGVFPAENRKKLLLKGRLESERGLACRTEGAMQKVGERLRSKDWSFLQGSQLQGGDWGSSWSEQGLRVFLGVSGKGAVCAIPRA